MSEPIAAAPLRAIPPPPLQTTGNPTATPWVQAARAWLASFPSNQNPAAVDVDAWIDAHLDELPEHLRSVPRSDLHVCILSLRKQGEDQDHIEHPYRFQRSDTWKPMYKWLESLDKDILVSNKEITDWLSANPGETKRLLEKYSRYHLMHYVQRMHLKMLKKKGKLPKALQLSAARASVKGVTRGVGRPEVPVSARHSVAAVKGKKLTQSKRKEAYLKYQLLTDIETKIMSAFSKHGRATDVKIKRSSFMDAEGSERNTVFQPSNIRTKNTVVLGSMPKTEQFVPAVVSAKEFEQKKMRNPIIVTPAWCFSEVPSSTSQNDQPSTSNSEQTRSFNMWKGHHISSSALKSLRKNVVICLQGREIGVSWRHACSYGRYSGRDLGRWIPFFAGWQSIGNQFESATVDIKRRSYSSWQPTWCSYASNPAVTAPNQRIQKVLCVKFHPEGLPQLVCSTDEGPNELMLYNLLSGKAIPLKGHGSQIQAVDFAVKGASVVSCSSKLLKVWDCITGSCLYTLGGNESSGVGHMQKINALAVNKWQSCIVVTSGAKGDGKLLLWNALRGELASDLNFNLRSQDLVYPSINAMEFCNESLLACGSDCEHGGSAIVQLWDIEYPESFLSFSASDSYISTLKVSPSGNTIITGSADGTICLFDIRTRAAVNHLSVGSLVEATSVSFSSCGIYFSASSTSNNTLVWDTRLLPTSCEGDTSRRNKDMRFFRPLHCLSHGRQMPTAEYTGQLPGHVSVGDQGINDARWLHREPVLVTVSGNGSVAMWDITLGQPCVTHVTCHSRCINSVAVALNDGYICTGGDDQKIVLFQNRDSKTLRNWRLSHPINN